MRRRALAAGTYTRRCRRPRLCEETYSSGPASNGRPSVRTGGRISANLPSGLHENHLEHDFPITT